MNIDLTNTFKESRELINTWRNRYNSQEYPKKVVMNVFYRKYTIEKMWPTIFDKKYSELSSPGFLGLFPHICQIFLSSLYFSNMCSAKTKKLWSGKL